MTKPCGFFCFQSPSSFILHEIGDGQQKGQRIHSLSLRKDMMKTDSTLVWSRAKYIVCICSEKYIYGLRNI